MREGVEGYRARRSGPQGVVMHAMALRFARLADLEPETSRWPQLVTALMGGPLSAVSFRLQGSDAMADAPSRVLADARQFGVA